MSLFKKIIGINIYRKKRTDYSNIERMIDVPYLYIPINDGLEILVKVGDYVKKGQLIGSGDLEPSIHSPVSGEVDSFIKGSFRETYQILIVIKNDFLEDSEDFLSIKNLADLTPMKLINIAKEKGITGMGGTNYPTYLKLTKVYESGPKTLIINGYECEPYLNCDNRLMQEKAKEIITGIKILSSTFGFEESFLILESTKKDAIFALRKAIKATNVKLKVLKKSYPLGEERLLVNAVLGKEFSKETYPMNSGILVQNVATVFAIYESVILGNPLIERVVTVSGQGVVDAKNLKIKIGTPIKDILDYVKTTGNNKKLILGGPMTGLTLFDVNTPVMKNSGGLLLLNEDEINEKPVNNCIYCGSCVESCPVGLVPLKFDELVRAKEYKSLEYNHIRDCIKCGVCTYVCPSNRPLLESILLGENLMKQEVKNE